MAAFPFGRGQDVGGGDVDDLGGGVDELGDQPGAGDPVGLGAGAGDPFHDGSSGACWRRWVAGGEAGQGKGTPRPLLAGDPAVAGGLVHLAGGGRGAGGGGGSGGRDRVGGANGD